MAQIKVGTIFVPYSSLCDHGIFYTRVHLNRLIDRDQFPPAVQLSPNRIAWKLGDLEVWKANRPATRSGKVDPAAPALPRRSAAEAA